MDIPLFLLTLDKVPHVELKLFQLTKEHTLPDGSLDIMAISKLSEEVNTASDEASAHAKATTKLNHNITCLTLKQPSHQP